MPADPELTARMLLVGYLGGIRSERALCAEVRLNLARRWFCRPGLDGAVPDRSSSTGSAARSPTCSPSWAGLGSAGWRSAR